MSLRISTLFTLILLLYSCTTLTESQQCIADFYAEMGVKTHADKFEIAHKGDGISLYNNTEDHQFVILADRKFDEVLQGQLVLAFSIEDYWGKGLPMDKFFTYYEQTLQLAYQQKIKIPTTDFSHRVEPLIKTKWGQTSPYNDQCPSNMMAGCVPVAMAQIMNYYHASSDPAQMVAVIGGRAQTHYSPRNSVTNTFHIKPTFIDMGMYAHCRYISAFTRKELQQICDRDLQQGHPLLLSNGAHAFICDGQIDDYLHLNLGWMGPFNGYYRSLPAGDLAWEPTINSSLVCGIHPNEKKPMHREIFLKQAGQLADILGADSLDINTLVIHGPLNGADVALIRRMAGYAAGNLEPIGNLTGVDLRDAQLKRGDPYRTMDAKATGFTYRNKGEKFDFSQMSEKRWQLFCKLGYNHLTGYSVEKTEDGQYLVHFILKDTNDKYLFYGCSNLN